MKFKNIKILIISTTKFDIDGITNVILNYYRAMDKSDMQIDFVIPNHIRNDLRLELESFGSNVYRIYGRVKKPLSYIKRLSKLIFENKYDIVHAHGNSCTLALEMYAAKKAGVKVRISHGHSSNNKYKFAHKILRKPFNKWYTHAFACGEKAGKWLYNKAPFEIINNGIDVNKYKYNTEIREEYRDKYNINNKKVIGHVGNFTYPKNHEYLINIFRELVNINSDYLLMLIGDGQLRSDMEKKVNDLGLTNYVMFIGKTLDVPQLMQAMDMVIMPSWFEGIPLTLIEAQTACLPCFISDTISREVSVTDLIKFISLESSPKEWAQIINENKIIRREEVKDEVIGKIELAGYSIENNAIKMKNIYKQYIE